jgi:hypothetical protein
MSRREPKVFVTQVPSRRDHGSGLWVPTVNISPAEQYGEVVTLLPPGSQFFAAAEMTRLIKQRLHDLDYQSGDYLLPMGNPVIMAVASAVAARRTNGCLNVLVWDKQTSSYVSYELDNLN